jgi:hypothetical protein
MIQTVIELKIETKSTRNAALVLRAINHKLRQQMLYLIMNTAVFQ